MVDLALLQSVSYIAGALGVCVAAAYYVLNLRISQRNQELTLKALEQSAKAQELSLKTQETSAKTQELTLKAQQEYQHVTSKTNPYLLHPTDYSDF